jgi:hypothetical protein
VTKKKYTYLGRVHPPQLHVAAYDRLLDIARGANPLSLRTGLCLEVYEAVRQEHPRAKFDGFSYCADVFKRLGYADAVNPFGNESLSTPWDAKYGPIRREAAMKMAKFIRSYLSHKSLIPASKLRPIQ